MVLDAKSFYFASASCSFVFESIRGRGFVLREAARRGAVFLEEPSQCGRLLRKSHEMGIPFTQVATTCSVARCN
jgi:hypothetical protein